MLPVVAIVGQPNVGKSTLFNRLTRSAKAIVDDQPGVTRDRMYGLASFRGKEYLLIDTGGLTNNKSVLNRSISHQVDLALDEADAVIFLADCKIGNTNGDHDIASRLRRISQPVFVVINKAEGLESETAIVDFHELGLGHPFAVSAKRGSGITELMSVLSNEWPKNIVQSKPDMPRLAIIGRPNVGKSTLINALLGDERMIVADFPGTTRDSISVQIRRGEAEFTLTDTAGVRRKSKTKETIEKYSIVKTLQAIADCNVAILMLDAKHGLVEQDKAIAGLAIQYGKSIVIVLNKWDRLDLHRKKQLARDLIRDYSFLPKHQTIRISALYRSNIYKVLEAGHVAYNSAIKNLSTSRLNKTLADATRQHPPQRIGTRSIQLKYAHQGGKNPPIIVIHGNLVDRLSPGYRRYLANYFGRAFSLIGTPIQIETRTSRNPYQ